MSFPAWVEGIQLRRTGDIPIVLVGEAVPAASPTSATRKNKYKKKEKRKIKKKKKKK